MAYSGNYSKNIYKKLPNNATIFINQGDIFEIGANVIVCSKTGQIAAQLKRQAGRGCFETHYTLENKDWKVYEIIVTGQTLNFQRVFVTQIPVYTKNNFNWYTKLGKLFKDILSQADKKSYQSITLPLLGTGSPGVECDKCIKAAVEAVKFHPNFKHLVHINIVVNSSEHFDAASQFLRPKNLSKNSSTANQGSNPSLRSEAISKSRSPDDNHPNIKKYSKRKLKNTGGLTKSDIGAKGSWKDEIPETNYSSNHFLTTYKADFPSLTEGGATNTNRFDMDNDKPVSTKSGPNHKTASNRIQENTAKGTSERSSSLMDHKPTKLTNDQRRGIRKDSAEDYSKDEFKTHEPQDLDFYRRRQQEIDEDNDGSNSEPEPMNNKCGPFNHDDPNSPISSRTTMSKRDLQRKRIMKIECDNSDTSDTSDSNSESEILHNKSEIANNRSGPHRHVNDTDSNSDSETFNNTSGTYKRGDHHNLSNHTDPETRSFHLDKLHIEGNIRTNNKIVIHCSRCKKGLKTTPVTHSCGHTTCVQCAVMGCSDPGCQGDDMELEHADNSGSENSLEKADVDMCAVCMDVVTNPKRLDKCKHVFCTECIDNCFKLHKPVCPTCGTVYGAMIGTMPPGTMEIYESSHIIEGYKRYGSYVITYTFPSGVQGPEHPNPGIIFCPTTRTAYLPASPKGTAICKMLKVAFLRKLTFTVGQSTTTGRENMVTWNDIHHKTSLTGGPTRFGYPDETYLCRVLDELSSKGVTYDAIRDVIVKTETVYVK